MRRRPSVWLAGPSSGSTARPGSGESYQQANILLKYNGNEIHVMVDLKDNASEQIEHICYTAKNSDRLHEL